MRYNFTSDSLKYIFSVRWPLLSQGLVRMFTFEKESKIENLLVILHKEYMGDFETIRLYSILKKKLMVVEKVRLRDKGVCSRCTMSETEGVCVYSMHESHMSVLIVTRRMHIEIDHGNPIDESVVFDRYVMVASNHTLTVYDMYDIHSPCDTYDVYIGSVHKMVYLQCKKWILILPSFGMHMCVVDMSSYSSHRSSHMFSFKLHHSSPIHIHDAYESSSNDILLYMHHHTSSYIGRIHVY